MSREELLKQQLGFLDNIRYNTNLNIITCSHCGAVLICERELLSDEKKSFKCYDCDRDVWQNDCPDLFY